jgi:hypothetical protein
MTLLDDTKHSNDKHNESITAVKIIVLAPDLMSERTDPSPGIKTKW